MLWLCRILAFTQIFCYHDYQSLVFMVWLLHSTVYLKSSRFSVFMMLVYLPLFITTFLWYYSINIYGIINWTDAKFTTNIWYNRGFYQFTIPPLEVGFLFTTLFCMIEFCRLLRNDKSLDEDSLQAMYKAQNRRSNSLYQLFFILLIYIEYPLMLFMVIDGVTEMDIYHIMFIFLFIIYTLFPRVINKYSLVLLIYADVFVLIKYVYTLVV